MFQTRSTRPFSGRSNVKRPARRLAVVAAGALIAGAILLPAQHASAASTTLVAVGSASEEPVAVAAGDVGAVAIVDLTVDGVTGDICVNSSISGLSGSITAAHIHSGGVGVSGSVFVGLPNTATTVSGCVVATPAQAQAILAAPNTFYFNAHTAASPGGAVRAQLTTTAFTASITGAAEVPGPGDPDGAGTAIVTFDTTANRACVQMSLSGLDLPATGAHIHAGTSAVSGPIVVPLAAPTAAVSIGCVAADPAVIAAIVANPSNHYLNVHTTPYPNGGARGQLATRTATGVPTPSATTTTTTAAGGSTTTSTSTSTTTTVAATNVAGASATATVPAATVAPTTIAAPTTVAASPTTTVVVAAPTTTRAPQTIASTAPPATAAPASTAPVTDAAPAVAVVDSPQVTG